MGSVVGRILRRENIIICVLCGEISSPLDCKNKSILDRESSTDLRALSMFDDVE